MTVWGVVGSKQIRGGAQNINKEMSEQFSGIIFFSKLRYINTLVVRFSIFFRKFFDSVLCSKMQHHIWYNQPMLFTFFGTLWW